MDLKLDLVYKCFIILLDETSLQGQIGSISSSESQQQTAGNSQIYGTSRQNEAANDALQGTYSSYRTGYYALPSENVFPERPGQPECQFYMKTGDCKFGAVCRFHHPRERIIPMPDCVLSPMGLPLRPVSSSSLFSYYTSFHTVLICTIYLLVTFPLNFQFFFQYDQSTPHKLQVYAT